MFQQAGMYAIWRLLFISLFVLLCGGYNITVPSSNITAGELKAFPWSWTAADSQLSTSGIFVVILVNCTKEFECPTQLSSPGVGLDTIFKIMEDSVSARNPINGSDASGKLFLTPSHPGDHMICTYGNLSSSQDPYKPESKFGQILASLKFIDQSNRFSVIQAAQANFTTMTPPANSSDPDNHGGYGRSDDVNKNQVPISEVVGGVVGGAALILLVFIIIILYRRVNKLHRMNRISLLSSTDLDTESAQPNSRVITPYNLDTMTAAVTPPLTGRRSLAARELRWLRLPGRRKLKENLDTASLTERQTSPQQVTPFLNFVETRAQHPGNRRAPFPVIQYVPHMDSGWRPEAEITFIDTPPTYNEAR